MTGGEDIVRLMHSSESFPLRKPGVFALHTDPRSGTYSPVALSPLAQRPAKCCGVVQQIRQVPGPGGRLRVPSRTDGRRAGLSDLSARFTSLRKLVLHALSEAAFVLVFCAGRRGRLVIPFLPGDACRTGRKKGLVLSFCN
jgi:hypothetical protein